MEEILDIFWLEGQVTERDRGRDRDRDYNKYINTFQIKKIFFTYWYSLKIAPNIYLNFDLRESNCKPENWGLQGNTRRPSSQSFLSNVSLQGQKPYSFDN